MQAADTLELVPDPDKIHARICELTRERKVLHKLLLAALDARKVLDSCRPTERPAAPTKLPA